MIERFRPLKSRRQIIHRLPWNWRRICSWSSCKQPRFPVHVPRADVAIKVLNGVTRFRLGILEVRLSFVHSNKNAIIVLPQLLSMAAIHRSSSSPLPALAASTIPLLAGFQPLVQDLLSAKYRGAPGPSVDKYRPSTALSLLLSSTVLWLLCLPVCPNLINRGFHLLSHLLARGHILFFAD
jgi:hypothetical protein